MKAHGHIGHDLIWIRRIQRKGMKYTVKSKWSLIGSIVQLVFGLLAIATYTVLGVSGENMTKWIVTMILAVAFVVLGIIGIIDYKSNQ